MRFRQLLIALFPALMFTSAIAAEPPSTASLSMKLFLVACVPSNGSVDRVEFAAKKLKLSELSSADTQRVLNGAAGRAWATRDVNGQFIIAAQAPDTCTVFVRSVDVKELETEFVSWLPPAASPFRFSKQRDETSESVRTLSYAIVQRDHQVASWALQTRLNNAKGQAILSVRAMP